MSLSFLYHLGRIIQIYNLFVYLKIDKYINAYFAKVFHKCEYPLFDEYELYKSQYITEGEKKR